MSKPKIEPTSILLVHLEDESKFIEKFTRVFESKGFKVIVLPDFTQVIDTLTNNKIELLVLDLDGKFQQGIKLCHDIKKNKALESAKIIALSGAFRDYHIYLDVKTKEEKQWFNVDLLVQKPIGAKNLYLLLKKEIAMIKGIDTFLLDSQ